MVVEILNAAVFWAAKAAICLPRVSAIAAKLNFSRGEANVLVANLSGR